MSSKPDRRSTHLVINFVMFALFVLLGTLSFQADSSNHQPTPPAPYATGR